MHYKVEIICPKHGSFWAQAASHVKGNQSGCPDCAVSGFNPNMPGTLYYIAVSADNRQTLYKIGITNLSVEKRFPVLDRAKIRIINLDDSRIVVISAGQEGWYNTKSIAYDLIKSGKMKSGNWN